MIKLADFDSDEENDGNNGNGHSTKNVLFRLVILFYYLLQSRYDL